MFKHLSKDKSHLKNCWDNEMTEWPQSYRTFAFFARLNLVKILKKFQNYFGTCESIFFWLFWKVFSIVQTHENCLTRSKRYGYKRARAKGIKILRRPVQKTKLKSKFTMQFNLELVRRYRKEPIRCTFSANVPFLTSIVCWLFWEVIKLNKLFVVFS